MKARKWPSVLMAALAMTVVVLAGCSKDESGAAANKESTGEQTQQSQQSSENENLNPSGFPIVKQPIKLSFMALSVPTPDWNDVLVFKEYEKMTNMDIEWQMITPEAMKEKKNLIMTSGDYPDAFHSVGLSTNDLITYGGQGIFIPLNDLIDKYAPNFKKLLDQYPEIKRGLTMPDGKIYSFPRIFDPDFTSVLMGWKLWINKDFLDKLNMKEPETLEDFYRYLKAVKENDLNGNGKKDEIPFALSGDNYVINIFKGAFGLGNRGIMHPYVDVDPGTQQLRFIPADPRYKEMLQFLNKLYTEGLINEDLYTVKSEQIFARASEGLFGSVIVTNPRTAYNQTNFIGANVLTGPHGDKLYSDVKSSLVNIGGFVITNKNKYPAETVRWIDYFYGEEGIKMFFMGIEGVTYKQNPDGSVEYTELITKNPDGLSFTQAISKYLTWRTGGYPSVVTQKYFDGSEGQPESIEAAKKLEKYKPQEVWPSFNFTLEESEVMSTIGADIQNYVQEAEAQFITGKMSFNDWGKYVDTLKKMGLDQYMQIYKAAYERYRSGK